MERKEGEGKWISIAPVSAHQKEQEQVMEKWDGERIEEKGGRGKVD